MFVQISLFLLPTPGGTIITWLAADWPGLVLLSVLELSFRLTALSLMLLRLLLLFALLTSRSTMLNMDIISAIILKVLMSLFAESRKLQQNNVYNTKGGDWFPHPQILLLAFDPQSASPPGNQRTGSGFGFAGYLWEPAWFRSYWVLRKG